MTDFNPEDRKLCPDGSCIGLIGDSGRCKVCGRSSDGTPGDPISASADGDGDDYDDDDVEDDVAVAAGGGAPFDDDRELCPDGACIGVIGSDGKCKVCGRSAGT